MLLLAAPPTSIVKVCPPVTGIVPLIAAPYPPEAGSAAPPWPPVRPTDIALMSTPAGTVTVAGPLAYVQSQPPGLMFVDCTGVQPFGSSPTDLVALPWLLDGLSTACGTLMLEQPARANVPAARLLTPIATRIFLVFMCIPSR